MKLVNFRGIYPTKRKETSGVDLVQLPDLEFYNVPLQFSTIPESEPCVRVGDTVKKGTVIAKPVGKVGLNVYSPVSGKILNVFEKMNTFGKNCKHILIMNDHKDDVEDFEDIASISDVVLLDRLKLSGIIDTISFMPSYLKYSYTGTRSYNKLLILMDSSDPNDTVNESLTEFKMEEVVNGARYFMNITSATTITFVFTETNFKLANKLKKHIQETKKNYDFRIKFIPNKYPFDNPYILANLVTGKKIDKKTSFLDAGISIESAEACYNFCRAVEFNKPVTNTVVTVDGTNVSRKGNYIVPNGASFNDVLKFVGIEDPNEKSILIDGNEMSGKAQFNKDVSIALSANAIVFNKYDDISIEKENPCISCGKCVSVCPMFLNPQKLERAYLDEDYEELERLKVQSCIECGCCSYVCPAKRFLTQRIAAAKFYSKQKRGDL